MRKKFKVGQNVNWVVEDFDGSQTVKAIIEEVFDDHCIARSVDGMALWIGDFNEGDFQIVGK